MKKPDANELNRLIFNSKSCDEKLFSEMRTNLLLISGDHWKSAHKEKHERINKSGLDQEVKLKITKNHLGNIMGRIKTAVIGLNGGVEPAPYNPDEQADVKAADIAKSVWQDAEEKLDLETKKEKWAASLIDLGECWAFFRYDPLKGRFLGYEQKVDDEGYPVYLAVVDGEERETILPKDMITGQPFAPAPSDKPVFSGLLDIEVEYPFNIFRAPEAETFEDSPYLVRQKMSDLEKVKAMVQDEDEEEKRKKIDALKTSSEQTFKVFEASTGEYSDSDNGKVLVSEIYYKPSYEYPEGYFYILCGEVILAEGELPFGIWPFEHEICDAIPTSPRGRSKIKQLRPGQAELNRLASSIAYHQIVNGNDKVYTQAGTKVSAGPKVDGIRNYIIAGAEPKIVEGKSGSQFFDSYDREVRDLYQIVGMDYETESQSVQDLNVMLYKNMQQQARHSSYAGKLQRFLTKVCSKYLSLGQHYLDTNSLIRIAGKNEWLNVEEFKNLSDKGYQIKPRAINNDVNSVLGKQVTIQAVLQYLGSNLPNQLKLKLIKSLPFLENDQAVKYITLDEDIVTNDILAMDRGVYRPAKPSDNHAYILEMLRHRMSQPSYEILNPQIKQMYEQKYQEHTTVMEQNAQKLKQLQDGMIPTSGPLTKVDIYQNVTGADGQISQRVQKVSLPMSAILDLMNKLQQQGEYMQITANLDAPTQIQLIEQAFGQQANPTNPMQAQQPVPQLPQQQNGMIPQ